ncbi:VOC family protein [Novosphingobium taihuense]|uniref:VOC domain-containing protein n=1 Tax=Novosphingobium taihuense TaxID=260085 RepID=A0A7W7A886_9SPHN|nr:VOC family protein [Novosphingobium taihuense]MBB4612022.1 hypothetical protein [Novosphingobium taihuense]TWH88625.1 hypothetical protein IQ25_00748 [Novosphingobium taihuense]
MSRPVPFCWYDLMTSDADGAADFYGKVIGWKLSAPDPQSPMDYRMILRSDGGANGGVLQLTEAMRQGGARPAWVPYLAVPDIDTGLAAIEADGGRALMPRTDIAEGSFAMMTDPQGALFYVMQPRPPADRPDAQSDAFKADGVQHVRWHDLATPDPAGAKAFYARHFGFEFNNAMPMGELGEYAFIDFEGQALGGIMPLFGEARGPGWQVYFGVASVTQARAAIANSGGKILAEPHQVPGGDWVVIAQDPQGAQFGVVGPKGE